MNVTVGDLTSLIYAVGGAIAMLAAGYVAIRRWLRTIVTGELGGINRRLETIEKELTHNGGSSLKDDVAGVRRDLAQERIAVERRHRENVDELERLGLVTAKVRRVLIAHLRLGHRQAHTETPTLGLSDRALDDLDRVTEDLERYRRRRQDREDPPR